MMMRASIQLTAMALALFLAAPAGLRADDPSPIGGSSPFGKALDEQKIREDFAKLRDQLDHQNDLLKPKGDSKFHRWSNTGTKRSVRERNNIQRNFSDPSRDLRESQRDQLRREAKKRNSSGSSSRESSNRNPASS
jgi:hypothetical protein